MFDSNRFVGRDPVQVTSPEQFVPLYLAYFHPHIVSETIASDRRESYIPISSQKIRGHYSGKLIGKVLTKKFLLDYFKDLYPKQYVLPVQDSLVALQNNDEPYVGINNSGLLSGSTVYGLMPKTNNLQILPGLIYCNNTHRSTIHAAKSKLNLNLLLLKKAVVPDITVGYIVLVKAKWIPVLKVQAWGIFREYELRVNLPMTDIKILQNESFNSTLLIETNNLLKSSGMFNYIKQEGITIKKATSTELLSYVIGTPVHKTKEEVLDEALKGSEYLTKKSVFSYAD